MEGFGRGGRGAALLQALKEKNSNELQQVKKKKLHFKFYVFFLYIAWSRLNRS